MRRYQVDGVHGRIGLFPSVFLLESGAMSPVRMKQKQVHIVPRPFLKWVGGKGQLLEELCARFAKAKAPGRYHEPFVGGGALFFGLYRQNRLSPAPAFLSDGNERLIETYWGLQEDVEAVIGLLEAHRARHDKEYYYQVRAQVPAALIARAARIIYLNKTCFNGLFRENRQGLFNVPIGKYVNPLICDAANLRAVSGALKNAEISVRPFASVLDHAVPGDFVYFDPPYHPLSTSSSFTAYHEGGFGEEQQKELAEVFRELDRRGIAVMLSNSMCDFVRGLFSGFRIDTVYANRAVNRDADKRGKIPEAVVMNF